MRLLNELYQKNSNSKMSKTPRAVQLISVDENKQLRLEEEAIKIIQSFSEQCKNFSVVVVVGKYRTGKSYLINQVLLQQNQGFQVGSTVNACTKGLWMWSELIYFDSGRSKEPVPAILIDTEGIGSVEEEQNHDVKIFLLAMLMSSYFIYNSVGTIDDMALQNLGLIVNLTKMLQKADESTQRDLFETFPSFLWILRDFTLRLEDEIGNKITPKEYLENALKPLKGFSESIENKNKIRRHITQFFQERDCITLVRPTQDEKDLQHLSQMKIEELRVEFQDQILALRKKFAYKVQLKQYKGRPTTPYSFVEMCKHFVNAINEGNLPVIESQWQMICKQELNRTLIGGIQIYKECIDALLSQSCVTQEQLERENQVYKRKARQYLDANCLDKESDEYKNAKKQVKSQIQELFLQAKKNLDSKHKKYLEERIEEFLSKIDEQNEEENVWNLVDMWDTTNKVIWNSGANQQLISEYTSQIQRTMITRMHQEFKKTQFRLKSYSDNEGMFQAQLDEYKQKFKKQEDDLFDRLTANEKEKNQIRVELECEKNKNLKLQQQILQSQSSIDSKVGEYMGKFKQIEKSYNEQLGEKDTLIAQLESKVKQNQCDLDKTKALLKQQDLLSQQEISSLRRDVDRLKDEVQDKNDMIQKLKQSIAEEKETISQYSSIQPRRTKYAEQDNLQKEMYEFQVGQLQQQIEEQKKIINSLIEAVQSQKQQQQESEFREAVSIYGSGNNKGQGCFLNQVHQLMGYYLQLQHQYDDTNLYQYKNTLKQLGNLVEDDHNASGQILSERNNLETQRIEKTMSSESPKNFKSLTHTGQNINPFRSPDQPKYQNSKMTIMQMFIQHKTKEIEQEKIRKSSQLENQLKNRGNIHLQRKNY